MIMNDGLTEYQYKHNQKQKDIMEWLRYNLSSTYLVYNIFVSKNNRYPNQIDYMLAKDMVREP